MSSDRAGTTRPHLARLSDWKDKKGDDEPRPSTPRDRYLSGSQDDMEEKEVIVHEVSVVSMIIAFDLSLGSHNWIASALGCLFRLASWRSTQVWHQPCQFTQG